MILLHLATPDAEYAQPTSQATGHAWPGGRPGDGGRWRGRGLGGGGGRGRGEGKVEGRGSKREARRRREERERGEEVVSREPSGVVLYTLW